MGREWEAQRRQQLELPPPRKARRSIRLDVLAGVHDRQRSVVAVQQPLREVTIDNVQVSGTVSPTYVEAQLVGLEQLGADGRWHAISRRIPLRLVAGSEVFLRGVVRPVRSTRLARVQLSLGVPDLAGASGTLSVHAGKPFLFGSRGADNFDELLTKIDTAATGDTLRAALRVSRQTSTGRQAFRRQVRTTAPTAIVGHLGFDVRIVSPAA
jgi:hypothetical protein